MKTVMGQLKFNISKILLYLCACFFRTLKGNKMEKGRKNTRLQPHKQGAPRICKHQVTQSMRRGIIDDTTYSSFSQVICFPEQHMIIF